LQIEDLRDRVLFFLKTCHSRSTIMVYGIFVRSLNF